MRPIYKPAGNIVPGDRIVKSYWSTKDAQSSRETLTVDMVSPYVEWERKTPRVSIKCGDRIFNHRPDDPIEIAQDTTEGR